MSEPSVTTHRLQPMIGRDPHEEGRAASPLELLYDLTFVVAIGVGASYFAELTAAGHLRDALIGFGFVMFAVQWAWINFSWLASAFDTDDWLYRLITMVQMTGVVILALGIPPAFKSIEEGPHFDNRTIVLGYVVMRIGLVTHWLRAARGCEGELHRTTLRYAFGVLAIQVLWVIYALAPMSITTALLISVPLFVIELAIPLWAERRSPTPWHAHHIAERYGLFAIIALGEGVVGTVAPVGGGRGEGREHRGARHEFVHTSHRVRVVGR
ncbi:low temperature requirement protein A [Calidifontibacter sp. DB0510]|uniref:Low temperature requirement protein A n=1 Tax=Metallococcus carri TaxID=1656884 RepID=A0A967B361_9MICO|nr:low temperature requirement protein A [Metallococcus carri]NHN57172.1 low temperature requirement protein A [Metallococcus carri]NOP38025.1 low temperature requirement protein A [Calidifontibacter sp. DB2511S]